MDETFVFLTRKELRALVPPADLVPVMASALEQFSAREVIQPLRTVLPIATGRFLGLMPAWLPRSSALGAKLLSFFPANAARGLPTHLAAIVLVDPETGAVLAVMDGSYVTEVRTAAVSALSVQHLARPAASRLAILGTGVQARSHLAVLAASRPLESVSLWSPDAAQRARLIEEMQPQVAVMLIDAPSAERAVVGADIIVVATTSTVPVLQNAWVADGAHVAAIGACRPDHQELDPALVARARLIVDSREAALSEAGDIVRPMAEGLFDADHITAELGEVVAGRVPGRTSDTQVTLFKSLGLAVEDVAVAELARRRAVERGLGTHLRFD